MPSPHQVARDVAAVWQEHQSARPTFERADVDAHELLEAVAERLLAVIPRTAQLDPWERLAETWVDGFLLGVLYEQARREAEKGDES